MNKEIYQKIIEKKEFSQLPKKDVEMAFELFNKEKFLDEEKIKLTRDLLRKVYFAFGSLKLLNLKILEKKNVDEILKKHLSTKERIKDYGELYERILKDFIGKKITLVDFGAGINGMSYNPLSKLAKVEYIGVEAVGQLVDLMNLYFKKEKIRGKSFHLSLFELNKIEKLIKEIKGKKIIFLFKVLDSLEMIERDYSKTLLKEITPLADRIIVSFATKSLIKRTSFKVKRNWIVNFIKENFMILDDFELSGERYLVFCKRLG